MKTRLTHTLTSILLTLPLVSVSAAELETQTNRDGAVTVEVTPRKLSQLAASWDFEVVLNTHTAALDQDMKRAAVLIDGAGNEQPPFAWNGDPPGGHHRKGVLRFQPLPALPEYIELRISGIGGVSQRTFRWRLAE